MFGAVVCAFLLPQVIRFVVDNVIGDLPVQAMPLIPRLAGLLGGVEAMRANILLAGALVLGLALMQGACNYAYRRSLAMGAEGLLKRLRDILYEHIQYLPYKWHIDVQTGDIIQRCTSDVEVVRSFVASQLVEMVRAVVLVVFAYSVLFPMNFALAAASFVFLPVILAYSFVFLRRVSARFLAADEAEGELLSIAQENFTGVRVVRAFGRERFEVDRFGRQNSLFAELWMQLGKLLSTYWGLGGFLTGMQMVTTCAVGAWQAAHGDLTLGEFIVFLNYNTMIIWPVRGLGRVLSEASKTGVSLGRIAEILNAPIERDPPEALVPEEGLEREPFEGDIVFDRVNFSYDGANPVLRDVSFTVKSGTTLGILGATGSGKTTVAQLLCRLYDVEPGQGEIRIGGADIRRFSRRWLRRNVGIVLQEPFLYSRTIRENIASLSPHYTDGQIRTAAEVAHVDGAIEQFAKGYDTIVGERGVTLSGGQKQRVAIARTLIASPPIMIFDDSLSAVDTETDAHIRAALERRMRGVTTIIIAHRIASIAGADHVLVMEGGRISEQGAPAELMARDGIFRRVSDMQRSVEDEVCLCEREVSGR